MSKAALLELAERVEKTSGADRELDAEIAAVLNLFPAGWRRGVKEASADAIWFDDKLGHNWCAPYFTSSLDAAMTLVPKNIYWIAAYGKRTPQEPLGACALYHPGVDAPFVEVEAHSVALALVAAALRARAQQESTDA